MLDERRRVAVVGAGLIGPVVAGMLSEQGHEVTLGDASALHLERAPPRGVATAVVDASNTDALSRFLRGHELVVSACPYYLNKGVADAAVRAGTDYFDLTEDVATTAHIRRIAAHASVALVPQCGLAPGFVGVLGADLATRFERVRSLKLRVGALPLHPTNALRYNLTWSADGVINEYCNPCEAILGGRRTLAEPLEGLETVLVDGVEYEAFNTSGGLGTLTESMEGQLEELSYKTLRYPGHAALMRVLLRDLGLAADRETMRRLLAHAAPFTSRDLVLVFVTAIGERAGRIEEESVVLRYDGTEAVSAIQLTTAAGCVAMVELFLAGKLPGRGFVRQEDARLEEYLATQAGAHLATGMLARGRGQSASVRPRERVEQVAVN